MAKHDKQQIDPLKLQPESIPQDRAATTRVDTMSEGDQIAHDIHHQRAGLADPQESVRAEFEAHAARAPTPAEDDADVYRGPFIVHHTFRYTAPDGSGVSVSPTRPTPGGGYERRVIQRGDIPDDVAQEMFALGALVAPAPPEPPKPRPRPPVPRNLASR